MFLILLVLWLVFAGSLTAANLILGALVCGLITLLCARYMGYDPRRFYGSARKLPMLARYLAYLLKEIVRENFDVLRFIYRKGQPKPMLVHFRTDLKSEGLRTLVANSITLTPGTYTVRLEGDEFAVHALDEYFQIDIEHSAFAAMARKLEDA